MATGDGLLVDEETCDLWRRTLSLYREGRKRLSDADAVLAKGEALLIELMRRNGCEDLQAQPAAEPIPDTDLHMGEP